MKHTAIGEDGHAVIQRWDYLFCGAIWQVDSRDVYLILNLRERIEDASAGLILIFLTDGSHRTTLRDLLHVHGYRAVMAESGEGFLYRIHADPRPVLLLMDFPTLGSEAEDFFAQKILVDYIDSIPLLTFSGLTEYIERPATTLLPDSRGIAFLIKLIHSILS